MDMKDLLEAKIAVVRLKHAIVKKWLINKNAPRHQFEELDRYERRDIDALKQSFAHMEIIEHLAACETKLEDSHATETGHVHN